MPLSRRADGSLVMGGVALETVASSATPTYVYDLDAIASEARDMRAAFDGARHLVAYAIKANSAGSVVRTLVGEGCGADVVSGAELDLAVRIGVAPADIVFSGVAKSDDEIDRAIACGSSGIAAIQLESMEELERVAARARAANRVARISIRINPEVDAETLDTHSYIATGHDEAKFGVPLSQLSLLLERFARTPDVKLVGLGTHVGSQFVSIAPYVAAATALLDVAKNVRDRFVLEFIDTGGGFGIDYGDGCHVRPADFIRAVRKLQRDALLDDLALYCEPGRSLVGAHGLLVARVIQCKLVDDRRRWIMIDAGMNDLMRPALYQARHRIVPLVHREGARVGPYRVVGPVCESSDDFGVHDLPVEDFSAVAILDAGAYGYSMASRYNGRALPAEVFLRAGAVASVVPRLAADDWVSDRLRA